FAAEAAVKRVLVRVTPGAPTNTPVPPPHIQGSPAPTAHPGKETPIQPLASPPPPTPVPLQKPEGVPRWPAYVFVALSLAAAASRAASQKRLARAVLGTDAPASTVRVGRILQLLLPSRFALRMGRGLREHRVVAHDILDPTATALASAANRTL